MSKLTEIQERHDATLFIDWRKEFDPEWQPHSLSNAEQCHQDRETLLGILAEMKPYLHHSLPDNHCDYMKHSKNKCTCGLQAILDKS